MKKKIVIPRFTELEIIKLFRPYWSDMFDEAKEAERNLILNIFSHRGNVESTCFEVVKWLRRFVLLESRIAILYLNGVCVSILEELLERRETHSRTEFFVYHRKCEIVIDALISITSSLVLTSIDEDE